MDTLKKTFSAAILLSAFSSPAFPNTSCEHPNFLFVMKQALDENPMYTLINDGVEVESGEAKALPLNMRLLAITTHMGKLSRATYFLGRESTGDESSYVYTMVNHRNKIFDSVSRRGYGEPEACSVKFEVTKNEHSMTIELNADRLNPRLTFTFDDESYTEYRFTKQIGE